ncbi:L-lactate dehydrogenase (cytochrome) [Kutzneria buriramensis]|uniref:L-lactate dehydrogenase (Cytochrome) n=1 Tax=Kutzneria buriramensis TaxID=1045776 RepID=A0A3E0I5X7_9PSEU|nr:L-lactate dehydrogenase (cytochrome) [Kutzneria buriramensis]
MTRRVPRLWELRLLPRRPELDPVKRAHTVSDLRAAARKRAPKAVFEYLDGGSDGEITLHRNRSAYDRVEFHPRVLVGGEADTATAILGQPASLPLVLAPTGYTRMMHPDGEPAVARAATAAGIPYVLSTMGTTAPEVLRCDNLWFQLYVWDDRGFTKELIDRARGCGALVLTVDTPVPGNRIRDAHNRLSLPPRHGPATFLDFGSRNFARDLKWSDLAWLRETWSGPLVVKGIQGVADAVRAADFGADAIVLSNHGGRQLDRSPPPWTSCPPSPTPWVPASTFSSTAASGPAATSPPPSPSAPKPASSGVLTCTA